MTWCGDALDVKNTTVRIMFAVSSMRPLACPIGGPGKVDGMLCGDENGSRRRTSRRSSFSPV